MGDKKKIDFDFLNKKSEIKNNNIEEKENDILDNAEDFNQDGEIKKFNNDAGREYVKKALLKAKFTKGFGDAKEVDFNFKDINIMEKVKEKTVKDIEEKEETKEEIKEEKKVEVKEEPIKDIEADDVLSDLVFDEEEKSSKEKTEEEVKKPQEPVLNQDKDEEPILIEEKKTEGKKEAQKPLQEDKVTRKKVFGVDLGNLFKKGVEEKKAEDLVKEQPLPVVNVKKGSGMGVVIGLIAFIVGVGTTSALVMFVPEVTKALASNIIESAIEEETTPLTTKINQLKKEVEDVDKQKEDLEKLQKEIETLKTETESYKQDIINGDIKVGKYQEYITHLNNAKKEDMDSLFKEIEQGVSKTTIPTIPASTGDGVKLEDKKTEQTSTTDKKVEETKVEEKPMKAPDLSKLRKALNNTVNAENKTEEKVERKAVSIPSKQEQVAELTAGELTSN